VRMEEQNQKEQDKRQQKPEVIASKERSQAGNADAEKNKGIAIAAYFIFFLPLLTAKESKFAMYHANQAFLLLVTAIVIDIVGSIIPVIGWFIILPLGWLFVIILLVMGIMNASKGEMKPLPLIGELFTVFK